MPFLTNLSLRHEKEYPEYVADYAIELAIMTGMRVGCKYVIPSSLHEVLIVDHNADPMGDLQMVREVNSTVVEEEDILSNSVYEITKEGLLIAATAA